MDTHLLIVLTLFILLSSRSWGVEIEGPFEIVSPAEFALITKHDFQPDASLSTVRVKQGNYWYLPMWDKRRGGIVHAKTFGNQEQPFGKVEWIKNKNELFKNITRENEGNYWIVNTYTSLNGILAFIHVENAQGSNDGGTGKSRVALGWSSDGGETFSLLGNIIVPFGDPRKFNVQGIPYIIRYGFFYIYFHDTTGLSVARAPVEEVISAAQTGKVTEWMKYAGPSLGFTSKGIGGRARNIGIDGISHTDAACRRDNGKCYLVLTRMNYQKGDTWIKLFESVDGITWKISKTIIQEPTIQATEGFQYATIIDREGNDNGEIGDKFNVICYKNFQQDTRTIVEWGINLTK